MGVVVEYADRKGEPQWRAPENTTWDYSVFGTPAKPAEPDGKFDLYVQDARRRGQAFQPLDH